jgi:integrase
MKITLRHKKLKNDKSSLYIEFYKGSQKNKKGILRHDRTFEYLRLYLFEKPKNAEEKRKNKEALQLAENILAIRKSDYITGKYRMKNERKGAITFLDYYRKLLEDRYESKANYDNWDAALKHIEKFCSEHGRLKDINVDFVKDFKKYLDNKARTRAGTPLSLNSKYTYFNKFRAALRQAYTDNYLEQDVVKSVKSFPQAESVREYLTYSELQALTTAYCKYPILKNAFIFSCLTGLRWSDINKMTWSEIRDEDNGARLIYRQKKTDGLEYLYVSDQARMLIGNRRSPAEKVFKGLKYGAHFNAEILRWCMRAGITKHITFHSARHTNAVLMLENGADIYTVSKRLGHRELRTTEIYTKIIDKKMKEAANLIPELNLDIA